MSTLIFWLSITIPTAIGVALSGGMGSEGSGRV